MLERVVSGGQTGADQAGLRAARAVGLPTGGWAPQGWHTETGPAPWLASWGLVEFERPGYPARTRANVRDSDGTLVFLGPESTRGTALTLDALASAGKTWLIVPWASVAPPRPSNVLEWLAMHRIKVLNVAGPRESRCPGIGERAERFLIRVFRRPLSRFD